MNKPVEDIVRFAQSVGRARASNLDMVSALSGATFSEALKTVGKRLDFVQLSKERDHFKAEILKVIGPNLNGFVLDDVAMDFPKQTHLEILCPENLGDILSGHEAAFEDCSLGNAITSRCTLARVTQEKPCQCSRRPPHRLFRPARRRRLRGPAEPGKNRGMRRRDETCARRPRDRPPA